MPGYIEQLLMHVQHGAQLYSCNAILCTLSSADKRSAENGALTHNQDAQACKALHSAAPPLHPLNPLICCRRKRKPKPKGKRLLTLSAPSPLISPQLAARGWTERPPETRNGALPDTGGLEPPTPPARPHSEYRLLNVEVLDHPELANSSLPLGCSSRQLVHTFRAPSAEVGPCEAAAHMLWYLMCSSALQRPWLHAAVACQCMKLCVT